MEKAPRTPRSNSIEKNQQKPEGEPAVCGQCGLPSADCRCSSFKEWGKDAVNAGSASGDESCPFKQMR